MKLSNWLLRLLPMWDYVCPRCRREVEKNSHRCPHCEENYGLPIRVPPKVLRDSEALEQYVHEEIFPKISAFQRAYLSQFFTTLFSDGFESGDFSAWSSTTGSPTIVMSPVHHGTCAMKVSGTATQYARKSYGDNATTSARAYINCESLPSASGKLVMWAEASNYSVRWRLFYEDSSGTKRFRLYSSTLGNIGMFNISLTLNQWYCIEVFWDSSAAAGSDQLRFYLDGVEKIGSGALDLGSDLTGQIYVGGQADGGIHYFDCVVVADVYVGVEGGQPVLEEVVDSLGAVDYVLGDKTFGISDGAVLADVCLKHWALQISDAVGFSDVVLRGKLLLLADSLGLSEVGGVDKALLLPEQVLLLDVVLVDKGVAVLDGMSLAEIVEKGGAGVVKTRIFLLLGDLAVQLTG